MVPYHWLSYYRTTAPGGSAAYPRLQIQPITPIFTPDTEVTPHIYCAVWRSAAEDFQLVQFTSPRFTNLS